MFFSDMERKTLALITPPSSSSSFRGGGGFGSSKKSFHCLLLLSCLLLSSVNTLHNLAEFDGGFINGYNSGGLASSAAKRFNGGNVCPIYDFDDVDVDVDDWIVSLMIKISNNLSDDGGGGVVWLSLKPLHIIEFKSFSGFFHIGEEEEEGEDTKQLLYANKKYREQFSVLDSVSVSSWLKCCGGNQCWDSVKFLFLYGKNTVVSGLVSSGNGVMEQKGYYYQCCWDSIKFLFLYGNEFSSGVAVFAVPMKATAPVLMLNLCKKPVFRVQQRAKKLSMIVVLVIAVLAAALLLLMFCFNDHHHHEFDNNNIAVGKVEKPITISREMNSLLRSISNNETMTSFDEEVTENMALKEETSEEALNLIVKTAKDKKRRRNKKNNKKKKGGVVINNGLLSTDVSSSHSGNSTPNSPMSPPPPPTTTIQAATKPAKPVLSHSATFPVSGVKSMMIERSSLAPNVRAPGSKTESRTEVKEEEEEMKKKAAKEYDIWGDHHLTWLNLMDRFKEVREGKSKSSGFGFGEEVDDNEADESFFVKGPQNYLGDSSVRFVSFCNQLG